MELREINTFLHVANLKSFSRAAEQLGYTQAAVTIQVRNLEKEMNVHLFDRIGKQTMLTHQGEIFYEYANNILNNVARARQAVFSEDRVDGHLTIGVIESVCSSVFPRLISEYHSRYPDVTISVVTDTPEVLLSMMDKNAIDIVFFVDKPMYSPKWIKVMEEPEEVVFVASSKHPFAGKKDLQLEDVIEQPFISTETDASYRFLLGQHLASIGKEIRPYLEIGNTNFIVEQLRENMGVSFLPEYVVRKDVQEGNLAILDVPGFSMQVWRQIIYHKDKWVTKEMKTFLEMAQELDQETRR